MVHKEEEVDTSACTLGNKRNIPSQRGSALDKGCKETQYLNSLTRQHEEVVTSTEVSHTRVSAPVSALPRRIKWDLAINLFVVLTYGKGRLAQAARRHQGAAVQA